MNAQLQIARMARQSADVLAHPNVRTFSYYSARASDSDALTYVAIGSFLIVLLSMLATRGGSAIGLVFGIVNQLFEFYVFSGITYFIGKQFGGIGTFENVTYTFSLFYVPILVLAWLIKLVVALLLADVMVLSLISFLQLAAQAFFAYLAVQGALRLRRKRDAALTVGIGLITLWVIQMVFSQSSFGGF
jgi:hypothetical protein